MKVCDSSHAPKVDPRVRRTHKMLEDAFRALLSEGHRCDMSVSDLTERATVNRATFYAHFEDMHHFATTLLSGDLESALHSRLPPGTPLTSESVGEAGIAIYEFLDYCYQVGPKTKGKRGALISTILQKTVQETVQHFFATWLDLDPEAMQAFPGSTPETVALALSWSLYGGATHWSRLGKRPSVSQSVCEIVALFIR